MTFNFKKYENMLVNELESIINNIITESEMVTQGAGRLGASISDYLENEFVKICNKNPGYIYDAEGAPKEKTKNPWDARCKFNYMEREEEIWIDFKAFQTSAVNSNPDIGTPNKIVNFIKEGNFYLVYILVYYKTVNNKVVFTEFNNKYTKVYLLKDINSTFRINPKPQMQVNISAEPTYRTREEFIELFAKKWEESYKRQIKKLEKNEIRLKTLKDELLKSNKDSQKNIDEE